MTASLCCPWMGCMFVSSALLVHAPRLCHVCGGPGRGQARAHVVSRPASSLWHFTSLALLHSESIAGGLLQRRLENRCRWTTTITHACGIMFTHQMLSWLTRAHHVTSDGLARRAMGMSPHATPAETCSISKAERRTGSIQPLWLGGHVAQPLALWSGGMVMDGVGSGWVGICNDPA